MVKKIIFPLGLILSLLIMFNNAVNYPVKSGYDGMAHLLYAKIISQQWRLPTFEETIENYNPPLFYLVSGLVIKGFGQIVDQDFFEAAKIWQYINIVLAAASLYLWSALIKNLYPKNKTIPGIFLLLLLILPVWYKTIVMFSIETWFLFTVSLALWFFLTKFRLKQNLSNLIILGLILVINLLSRLSSIVLVITIILGIAGLAYAKKISLKRMIVSLVTLAIIMGVGSGWYYFGKSDEGIYQVGEVSEPEIPLWQRQPLSFYIDIPFKLMMTYPMRQSIPINKLIPIYYSDFWGDFWNYFPQRRFGITLDEVRQDRETSVPPRIKALVLQNQINLIPTILIFFGFLATFYKFLAKIKKPDFYWLVNGIMLGLTILSWIGFIILLTKFPNWKGDSIKASYMLYLMPVFMYFLINLLLDLYKSKRIIFWPVSLWLIFAGLINLHFSWF